LIIFSIEITVDVELIEQVKKYNVPKSIDQSLQNLAHIFLEELEKLQNF